MVVAAIAKRIFGSANDRAVKRYQPKVDAINALEPKFEKLTDDQLREMTAEFRQAYKDGKSLDDLLVPAFALVREGATRIGGRIPVNPSGGLSCFGEAVPAQALAQVCELTWQLRGQAGTRQVQNARVGITANQGLFGHGSSVIVKR